MGTDFADYTIGFVGVISVPNGGTGLNSLPAGTLLYGNGTGNVGTLTTVAAGEVLLSQGLNVPPAWGTDLGLTTLSVKGKTGANTSLTVITASGQTGDAMVVGTNTAGQVLEIAADGTITLANLTLSSALTVPNGGTGASSCTAGQILTGTDSNTAAFSTPPGARVYNSTSLAIPASAATVLTFDSERFNNGSVHSTTTNTSRLTAPQAGVYVISAHAYTASAQAGTNTMNIRLNGSTTLAYTQDQGTSTVNAVLSISTVYHLSAGDYVEAVIYLPKVGGSTVSQIGNWTPEFAMQWIGP